MPTSDPATPLTRALGEFVARGCDLPQDHAALIRHGLADAVGCMIAGANEAAPRILRDISGPGTEATLFLGTARASAADAALINGTAAHALDFDDVAVQGHISAVLMPALFAEAEALALPGRRILQAYFAGYEVWAELISRQKDQIHRKGWHPTAVFGTVGAAAACAHLRGLTAGQSSHALAIAASQSAGLAANFGSMTKAFHVGRAAQAGLLSARMAAAGFTGAPDALEAPTGLLHAVSPRGAVDLTAPLAAGSHMERHGLTFKKFPTCLATHRAIEAVLQTLQDRRIDPDEVSEVEVTLSRRNAEILLHHRPRTALEAKFSLEFAVAASLITGRLGLEELAEPFICRDDVQALMAKVVSVSDDREDPATGYAPYDALTLALKDGSRLTKRIASTPGSPANPLSEADLRRKFALCLGYGKSDHDPDRLFDLILKLDTLPNLKSLAAKDRKDA